MTTDWGFLIGLLAYSVSLAVALAWNDFFKVMFQRVMGERSKFTAASLQAVAISVIAVVVLFGVQEATQTKVKVGGVDVSDKRVDDDTLILN